ncbi:hypothetical protein ACEWY4_021907 [Coilia grayii]|uniref:C2H2-type domain-containing protein n=1 Tax=Coilia grayii TaxID=363190 RepID=A0ABD1J5J4_9TELE
MSASTTLITKEEMIFPVEIKEEDESALKEYGHDLMPAPLTMAMDPDKPPDQRSVPGAQRPFFLWMPYRMWAYNFCCPTCGGKLVCAGFYETVRRVLDMSGWYFMATECLECSSCHKKVAGWSHDILEQLDITHCEEFPAVLTDELSCDRAVIGLLKEHTLGYSASRIRAFLVEEHTREWVARSTSYLSVLHKLRAPGAAPQVVTLPTMHQVPDTPSLMSVYVRDALMRLKETKARVTSIFGDILSIDSTRKVTKKFVGAATGTSAWITNVGNEYGQVLMSVLTAAEGDGLANMASGLMRRYQDAGKVPPKVMYVDGHCCAAEGRRKTSQLFHEWHELVIRLDPWHLMRQFARGVTSDSHQLYGLFMARLSLAIFEWDAGDLGRLREAKQSEEEGSRDIKLSARELVRHCRRRTRGVAETERLLLQVLVAFCKAKDSTGAPLIDQTRMKEIWSTQRRHLRCIQDPAGVELYTQTGEITKGGVKLPVYRCARGSTSLETFHHYMCRFIPGVPASDLRYQVYLLEGLVRWNENHGEASVDGGQCSAPHCLSAQLQHSFNQLSHEFGLTLAEPYTQPKEYTGELIGVEYLYSQMGAVLQQDLGDPDVHDGTEVAEEEWRDGDEGEGDEEQPEEILLLEHHHALLQTSEASGEPATATPESVLKVSTFQSRSVHPPPSHDNDDGNPEMEVQKTNKEEDVVRPDGNGGYHHTVALARSLVALRNEDIVSQHQATQIIALWQRITERDKAVGDPITSHQGTPTPGVDVLKRTVLGQAAKSPELSRLVEAIILELCRLHIQEINAIPQRWDSVMRDYRQIQKNVLSCPILMAHTRMQLFVVSKWTLTLWHNQRGRAMIRETTTTAVPKASAPQTSAAPLPAPNTVLQQPKQPQQPLQGHSEDTSGLAPTIRGPQANSGIVTTASAITSACANPKTCAIMSSSSSTTPNTSSYPSSGIEHECKTELSASPTLICKEEEILPVQIKQEEESHLKESVSELPSVEYDFKTEMNTLTIVVCKQEDTSPGQIKEEDASGSEEWGDGDTSFLELRSVEYDCKTEMSALPTSICKEEETLMVQIEEGESDLMECGQNHTSTGTIQWICSNKTNGECGKMFGTISDLRKHELTHTGVKQYSCSLCEKVFTRSSGLSYHQKVHTGERPYQCSHCGRNFTVMGHLNKHMLTHTKPHQCSLCGKSFAQKAVLKDHMMRHTGEKPHKCSQCDKSFALRDDLKYHQRRMHTREKPYECSQCGKTFAYSCHLKSHQRFHTGEKPHKCSHCGKNFTTKEGLKVHQRTHTGERPYTCSQCGKTFAYTDHLKTHMMTHTGEKAHECSQCGKGFTLSGDLKRHMCTYHGEKPHKCSQCGKGFALSGDLKRHMFTHTGEKRYKCSQCGNGFNHSAALKNHQYQIHNEKKPYICSQCGKAFLNSSSLKIHQRIHTEKNSYLTSVQSGLKKHTLFHTGEKPHKCSQCGKTFAQSGGLKRHMSTHTR